MTVCVAVKVRDCMVFAADSTTSVQTIANDGSLVVTAYDHADKLFNLRKGLPIAAMTAGIGNIGDASIATVSKNFRRQITAEDSGYFLDPQKYTIEDVTEMARRYFFDRFNQLKFKPEGIFQYWVGGYSAGADMGEVWSFAIQDGQCEDSVCEIGQAKPEGVVWGGQAYAIDRIMLGYDAKIAGALAEAGFGKRDIPYMMKLIARHTKVDLVNPAMPITDAIDLAKFLAETTKKFVRFQPGYNSVGGGIDVATITKHENFKWVDRKHFYPQSLNPLETDHADRKASPASQ